MRVLIFGDSITQGFWDTQGGWANRLRTHYDKRQLADMSRDEPTIFNLGISGDKTSSLLYRFDVEATARDDGQELICVFAIGANDTIYSGQEVELTPEKYKEQLNELTQKAKKFTRKILFVGLFPVVDKLLQPFPWGSDSGRSYSTERMSLFDQTLKNFCKENKLPVVDLFTPFSKQPSLEALFTDGIHPNDKGHKLIASLVKPELERLLG